MKELNLEVGQKCWSIQMGDCSVVISQEESPQNGSPYKYIVRSIDSGEENVYRYDFKKNEADFYPSLFESNPFEKNEKANLDGVREIYGLKETVSQPENKAELVEVLLNGFSKHLADKYNNPDDRITTINDLVYEKLKKLLESL